MEAITDLAKGIAVAGAFVAVFLLVLAQVYNTADDSATYPAYSENITLVNGTAVALTYKVASWTSLTNASNTSFTIPTSNYSVDTAATPGSVTLNNITWQSQVANATYTHEVSTEAMTSLASTIDALADIPAWFGLIVVALVAIILFFLLGRMNRAGENV